MSKPFVHLHLHTTFSLLDGANHIKNLVLRAKELGMTAIAMTDHGVMYGAIEFYQTCKKYGIKPIIGCEVYVNAKESRFDRNRSTPYHHLILLAKDLEGYHNLMRLSSIAHLEGFYYKPRVDKETLRKYSGGLICLSACLKGEVNTHLLNGNIDAAELVALEHLEIFGRDNYYLEMQDHGLDEQQTVNRGIRELCTRTGLRAVITNDVHYLHKSHAQAHEIMLCIQTNTTMSDEKRMRYGSQEFYFKSRAELELRFHEESAAFDLTQDIAERCNVEIVTSDGSAASLHFPAFPLPETWHGSREEYLVKLGKEGLLQHYGMDYNNPTTDRERELVERFNYEVEVIKKAGFVDYFLVVSDFVKWSRKNGVPVGPGRGSGAGSLLAYSLDITQLDPLRFDLLFERFLNPERVSPPDFDIDFCQTNRNKTIEYVTHKYGKEQVAQIVTYGQLGAKTVIRDIARVLEIPLAKSNAFCKLIPEEPEMTLAKAKTQNPEFASACSIDPDLRQIMQHAEVLEGFYRNTGVHAAGVVIGDKPLLDLVPLAKDKDGNPVTQYDKGAVEKVGLLKMDFLGLKTLTVIQETLELVKMVHGIELNLNSSEFNRLDDEKTFNLFQRGDTVGVFQFESGGMQRCLTEIKPNRIEDIIAITALYRPGPMENIPKYVARKFKREPVVYMHPKLENTLKETYGIFVYQEQVQRAAQQLAGYTLGRADELRRVMSRKQAEKMAEERPRFVEGCWLHSEIKADLANKIFDEIAQFAGYGFNKSHAAAYGVLSYQTAYLKAHYPVEFMCAQISSEIGNFEKLPGFVSAALEMGITVMPPDINHSLERFMPEEGNIRYGLAGIKSVGEGVAVAIARECQTNGPFSTLLDFCTRLDSGIVNKRVLEALIKCGTMDGFGMHRARLFHNIDFCIKRALDAKTEKASGQGNLFETVASQETSGIFSDTLPDYTAWEQKDILAYERELLGIYMSGHPLTPYRRAIQTVQTSTISRLQNLQDNTDVRVAGLLLSVTKRFHKKTKEPWAVLELHDGEYGTEALLFPEAFARYEGTCQAHQPVLVCGTVSKRDETPKIIVNEIFPLEEAMRHFCDKIIIAIHADENAPKQLRRFYDLAKQHPGTIKLLLCLIYPDNRRVLIQPDKSFNIDPNQEFLKRAEKVFGKKAVKGTTGKAVYKNYTPRQRWARDYA